MKSYMLIAFISLGLLSSTSAVAQNAQASNEPVAANRVPYQIIVTPNITKRSIRKLILQVEDDFVARFNELNLDDDYDIDCYKFTPTMSHIRRRICEPAFLIEARAENASEAAFDYSKARNLSDLYAIEVLTPTMLRRKMTREHDALQSKLEELVRTDEELMKIGTVLGELTERAKKFGKED